MSTGASPPLMQLRGFNLGEGDGDPIAIVLEFCREVPPMLSYFFDNESFRSIIEEMEPQTSISPDLFFAAFDNASAVLLNDVNSIEVRLSEVPGYRDQFFQSLSQIGFTGVSLELKANWFNYLLERAISAIENVGSGSVNFIFAQILKAIRKLLSFLNKLLDSLKIAIPGLDAIKEFKEVGEEYLSNVPEN